MKLDVFYEVIVPEHEERIDSWGCAHESHTYSQDTSTTYKTMKIPEKRYFFYKRKKAKLFCLENGYPLDYIFKRKY